MQNIDKIIDYIRTVSEAQCREIARKAAEECERILTESSRVEQEEYWKAINVGTKEMEQRLKLLSNLAAEEAEKQIAALHQEMLDEAFLLAAQKLEELPEKEFGELLAKLALNPGGSAVDLVSTYKNALSLRIVKSLFD